MEHTLNIWLVAWSVLAGMSLVALPLLRLRYTSALKKARELYPRAFVNVAVIRFRGPERIAVIAPGYLILLRRDGSEIGRWSRSQIEEASLMPMPNDPYRRLGLRLKMKDGSDDLFLQFFRKNGWPHQKRTVEACRVLNGP